MSKEREVWTLAASAGAAMGLVLIAINVIQVLMLHAESFGLQVAGIMMGLLSFGATVLMMIYYVRRYSKGFSFETGFPFMAGYSYLLKVGMFLGLLMSLASYFIIFVIIGAEEYQALAMNITEEMLTKMLGSMQASESMALSESMFDLMATESTPSIFSSIISGVSSYIIMFALIGAPICACFMRAPRPNNNVNL